MVSATQFVKVLLVDDHEIFRAGLRLLIESQPRIKVIGEVGNGAAAVEAVRELQPDVVLLDLDLNGEDGLDVLPQLLQTNEQARVLVLTGTRDLDVHLRTVRGGAKGLIIKNSGLEVLTKAIKKVALGEVWFDRTLMSRALTDMSRGTEADPEAAKIASLTKREREVVQLVGEGYKNHQIAERLFISKTTVRHHLAAIFAKLEVEDRLDLLIYANRHALAKLPR